MPPGTTIATRAVPAHKTIATRAVPPHTTIATRTVGSLAWQDANLTYTPCSAGGHPTTAQTIPR